MRHRPSSSTLAFSCFAIASVALGCSNKGTSTGTTSGGGNGGEASTSATSTTDATTDATSTSTGTGMGTGGGGGFVAPSNALSIQIGPIDVPAGVEDTQCIVLRLKNMGAMHVGQIHNDLIGVSHHMILYKVSDTEEQLTPQDCQPFQSTLDPTKGSPLMITQKHSDTLDLPKGVGFAFDDNQMMRMEMHYINPTQADASVTGIATLVPMDEADVQNEAGFVFAGSIDINLQPNQTANVAAFIAAPTELIGKSFFGFTGHEHQFGTGVTVDTGTNGAATTPAYDVGNAFIWSEPPTVYHDPPIVLPTAGGFDIKCTWDNTSSNTVSFGESANDEMCFFWSYYYPNIGSRVGFHTDQFGGQDIWCPGNPDCDQILN